MLLFGNLVIMFSVSGGLTGVRRYPCHRCNNRSYQNMGTLKRHLIYECGQEPQFKCTVAQCSYRGKRKEYLKQHFVTRHPEMASQVFPRK